MKTNTLTMKFIGTPLELECLIGILGELKNQGCPIRMFHKGNELVGTKKPRKTNKIKKSK